MGKTGRCRREWLALISQTIHTCEWIEAIASELTSTAVVYMPFTA